LQTASDSVRRARPLLGTFVEIEVAGATPVKMHAAIQAALRAVAKVHDLMSFHKDDSDVARLNAGAWQHPIPVHDWTYRVLETAIELHERSNGAFDVGIAPVLQQLGMLPRGSNDRHSVSPSRRVRRGIRLLPGRRVSFTDPGVRIDLGGIAKGFAADRAIETLQALGMPNGLVNAGGDLAQFGSQPEKIYIRDPRDPRRLLLSVEVGNQALASSGGCFDEFSSERVCEAVVIDPASGVIAAAAAGVTVRAASCMIADALTKIVMIAGTSATGLLDHYGADALIVSADGEIHFTAQLQSALCLAA
jgi:FAD:protein FMN transferase